MHPTLEIVAYDPSWPETFAREDARLRDALGEVARRIDHVGSTAVPDLGAKPVVDIQISVAVVQAMQSYRPGLEKLGYLYQYDPDFEDYPFFAFPPEMPRAFHVHVCQQGSAHERRHLAFRDFLRANAGERAEYERLKRRLAPQFRADDRYERMGYNAAKGDFIARIQARALGE